MDLTGLFDILAQSYSVRDWWPRRDDPFEVIVGAILIQRTTWANAARAIEALRDEGLLTSEAIHAADGSRLEPLIRPTGFYRAKAATLKGFCSMLTQDYEGELSVLLQLPLPAQRVVLLSNRGIGDETADAILVYAAGKPSFVVDAFTRRLLLRLGWIEGDESYVEIQRAFTEALPADANTFASYHALLVQHGQTHCRVRPRCVGCPTASLCDFVTVQRKDVQ